MWMTRGGHGPDQHAGRTGTTVFGPSSERARLSPGPTRCPLRGPQACHGQEILFQARSGTSPRGLTRGPNAPFLFFFSLKLSKIKKYNIKHEPGPQEARARLAGPWTKFGIFKPGPAWPATHGLWPGLARHFPKPAGRAHEQARPGPCPGLRGSSTGLLGCYKQCGFSWIIN